MKINDTLKKLRIAKNLSQSDMSKILEVSLSSYQKYERDKNSVTPSLDVLIKIADFYNVSVDYLLGRNTEVEIDPIEILAFTANFTELEKNFLSLYVSFNREERIQFLNKLSKNLKSVISKTEAELKNN